MGAAGLPLGRYLLGERLAVGGMGEVYVGVQRGMGDFEKPLAIKLLLPHLAEDENAIAEFLNEARVASRLSHQNVVQIFDVGQEGGRYYIAMELVRGVSLSDLLSRLEKRGEKLPPALVSFIAHGLLEGLHHAHELADADGRSVGLVHRDVSPHNLLISASGEVKLADFGIARVADARTSTRTGMVRGKPAYLAPEIFDGVMANRATDVFAAAVTIFQLATLRSPFRRETDAATMKAVITEPLPALASFRSDLPPALEVALFRATARDPKHRTATARELAEALPTLYGASAARELGALVRSVASESVEQIDTRAAQTTQLAHSTREASASLPIDVPVATVHARAPIAAAPPRRSRAWLALIAVPVLGLLGAAAAKVLMPAEMAVVPEPQPVAVVDAGVAAVLAVAEPAPIDAGAVEVVEKKDEPPVRTAPVRTTRPAVVSKPPAGPRIGYLTVDANPWATVRIKGRAIGDTPLYKFPLDEGDLLVELSNPDTGKTVSRRVKVSRGKETSLKVNMQ